eukprot:5210161-Pleurochrysis_carterae.AAC.1
MRTDEKDCATAGSLDSNNKQICTTTASVTANECLIVVPTTLVSTAAPRKSSAVGSWTINGGGWLSLFQNILNSITVPLETSPAKYERGSEGPE